MAKKPLIFVGIEGDIPDPLPKRGYVLSKTKALLPFGTLRRKENDHFKALALALDLKNADRKIFVLEKSIEFDTKSPKFSWDQITPDNFSDIKAANIYVSPNIALTYQKYFDFDLSNNIHFLTSHKEAKQRLRGLTSSYDQMVGRQKELNELKEITEQSFEDRGQIASICADGGMGKTRLWAEFEKHLENENILYFTGTFTLSNEKPYSAFSEMLAPFVEHFKENIKLDQNDQEILDYLLDSGKKTSFIKNLSPSDFHQNILAIIKSLISQQKHEKIVFILDDIHWADDYSKTLIRHLSSYITKTNHMILLIHRPDYKPQFSKELFYHQIKLDALDPAQIELQIKNMLNLTHITPSTLQKIHSHSKGNPFFVEEIFRHSIENNTIDPDQKILQDISLDQGLPMNIQSMVQTRLDNLEDETLKTLKILSVLGSSIYRVEAVSLIDKIGLDGEKLISLLEEEAYLIEISAFPENKIGFYHDIIYESLTQNNISNNEKKEYNELIANFLTEHYMDSNDKHVFRISDHLIQTNFQKSQKSTIQKAALKALENNQFILAAKYFEHLHKNKSLDKIHYSNFAKTLENANLSKGQEDFLTYWKENSEILEENPNTGYFNYYLNYLMKKKRSVEILDTYKKISTSYQKKYTDTELNQLKIKQCYALMNLKKWPELVHNSFKQLRLLNTESSSTKKMDYFYQLATLCSEYAGGHGNISLDFINKGISILQKNPNAPIHKKTRILNRLAYFYTVYKSNYKMSAQIRKQIIEESKEHGLISKLDTELTQLIVNYFFSGNYSAVIENAQLIEEITKASKNWHHFYSKYWLLLTYLTIGNIDGAKKLIAEIRNGDYTDHIFTAMKFYCMAHFRILENSFLKAHISYERVLKIYNKTNTGLMKTDAQLLSLASKIRHYEKLSKDEWKIIDNALQENPPKGSYNFWSSKVYTLLFSQYRNEKLYINPQTIEPKLCPNAYLKQKMYVEKIKLLDHLGEKGEAERYREEFREYRAELALKIPYEFQESFKNSPLFPVP